MVKIKIQTRSKKCQNKLNSVSCLTVPESSPLFQTFVRRVTIHSNPTAICSPCVPTRVKNEERNALAWKLDPSEIRWENSVSSMVRKATPSKNVTLNQVKTRFLLFRFTARMARPQVKLLVSKIKVSTRTNGGSKISWMEIPPKVLFRSTA